MQCYFQTPQLLYIMPFVHQAAKTDQQTVNKHGWKWSVQCCIETVCENRIYMGFVFVCTILRCYSNQSRWIRINVVPKVFPWLLELIAIVGRQPVICNGLYMKVSSPNSSAGSHEKFVERNGNNSFQCCLRCIVNIATATLLLQLVHSLLIFAEVQFVSSLCCHRHHSPPTHRYSSSLVLPTVIVSGLRVSRCQGCDQRKISPSGTPFSLRYQSAMLCAFPAVILWLSSAIYTLVSLLPLNLSQTPVNAFLHFPEWL